MRAEMIEFEKIGRNLNLALDLTVNCGAVYPSAPDHIKRMFNQAFFEKVLIVEIDEASSEFHIEAELREPFKALINYDPRVVESKTSSVKRSASPASTIVNGLRDVTELASKRANSFSNALLVDLASHNTNHFPTTTGQIIDLVDQGSRVVGERPRCSGRS